MISIQTAGVNVQVLADKSSSITVFFVGLGNMFSIVFIVGIVIMWKRLFHKGTSMKYFGFIILHATSYIVSLLILQFHIWDDQVEFSVLLPLLTCIVCEISVLAIIFSQSEKESLEEKLSEERLRNELQQIHYEEVKRRRAEVEQITRKNNEEVQMVKELLEKHEMTEAEHVLEKSLKRIAGTKEYPFCGIPIINVILSEKQKECETNGLKLKADIQIADDTGINHMDLCRIFGNLLDNAIRAGKQAKDTVGAANTIQLAAGSCGNYLIIKCMNVSEKGPGNRPEGTGYGWKILKETADMYNGDFRTRYADQKFEVQLTLQMRTKGEKHAESDT